MNGRNECESDNKGMEGQLSGAHCVRVRYSLALASFGCAGACRQVARRLAVMCLLCLRQGWSGARRLAVRCSLRSRQLAVGVRDSQT